MFLLIGLGNPGPKYVRNRHNIGFMTVEQILLRYRFSPLRKKFHALFSSGTIQEHSVHALLPQTYMNLSGLAVQAAQSFFKVRCDRIIVFHDDIDLKMGRVKVKKGGSNAGHNGLRSLDAKIGPDYWRVRIGIGRPETPDFSIERYVLNDFSSLEVESLSSLLDSCAIAIPFLLNQQPHVFLAHLHKAT